jgi:aldose 1-epimerase
MEIKSNLFGTMKDGGKVHAYTLSRGDDLSVTVIDYGATLQSVRMKDKQGHTREITLGFDTLDGFLGDHPFFGSTVGRVANRIANGSFTLDGKTYSLAKNNGNNHLHGGIEGFNRKLWNGEPVEEKGKVGVHFSYTSPDGEEGYPGTLQVRASYLLSSDGTLTLDYTATTDKATPVNLTNHVYWNLEGTESETIRDHLLTIESDYILPVDAELLPTGEKMAVASTPYDFTEEKNIDTALRSLGGIDHCYVVRGEPGKLREAATLRSEKTGIALRAATTKPGMQLYTGNFLEGAVGRDGRTLEKHNGICLETEHFPDAVNRTDFPSMILHPGEQYHHTTTISFYRK